MTNWESLLASMDEQWQSIEVDPSGNVRLPDGNYQVNLEETFLDESKDGQKYLWKITFKVLNGPHQGRLIFMAHVLDPDRLQYVKQDCYRLGFPLAKLSDLPSMLEKMLDMKLEVRLKTNGDYQNCYIQKRLDTPVENQEPQQQFGSGTRRSGGRSGSGNRNGRPVPPNLTQELYGPPLRDEDYPF